MAIMTNSDNDKNEQNVTESAEGKGTSVIIEVRNETDKHTAG